MGEFRVLELTIISAQHLKNASLFGKLHAYAVAWVDPSVKHTTHVDEEGGQDPVWNEKFRLLLDNGLLSQRSSGITIQIHSHGMFSDSLVGSVHVPFTEISEEARSGGKSDPQFLAFEIHKPSGSTTQGVLNISLYLEPQESAKPQIDRTNPSEGAYLQDNTSSPSAPAPRPAYPENPPPYGYPYPASEHQPVNPNLPPGYPPQQAYYPPGYPPQQAYYPQQPGQYPYPPQAPPGYPYPGGNPPPSYFVPPESAHPGQGGVGGGGGLGLAAGLAGGAVGGLLLGELTSDIAEHAEEEKEEEVRDEVDYTEDDGGYGDDDF